jgi:hypothetical protein
VCFIWRQRTLTYIALDLVQVSVFLFKEGFECEKGESRPIIVMKDRLCSGTTPIPGAFKSDAANDGP